MFCARFRASCTASLALPLIPSARPIDSHSPNCLNKRDGERMTKKFLTVSLTLLAKFLATVIAPLILFLMPLIRPCTASTPMLNSLDASPPKALAILTTPPATILTVFFRPPPMIETKLAMSPRANALIALKAVLIVFLIRLKPVLKTAAMTVIAVLNSALMTAKLVVTILFITSNEVLKIPFIVAQPAVNTADTNSMVVLTLGAKKSKTAPAQSLTVVNISLILAKASCTGAGKESKTSAALALIVSQLRYSSTPTATKAAIAAIVKVTGLVTIPTAIPNAVVIEVAKVPIAVHAAIAPLYNKNAPAAAAIPLASGMMISLFATKKAVTCPIVSPVCEASSFKRLNPSPTACNATCNLSAFSGVFNASMTRPITSPA